MRAQDDNTGHSRIKLGTVMLNLTAGGAQCSVTVSQSPATATQTMLLYMPGRDLLNFYKQNIDGVLKAVDANVPGDGRILVCYQPNKRSPLRSITGSSSVVTARRGCPRIMGHSATRPG